MDIYPDDVDDLGMRRLFLKQGLSKEDVRLALDYHDQIVSDVGGYINGGWDVCPKCSAEIRGSIIYDSHPFVNMFKHYKRHHIFRAILQEAIKSMR